MRIAHFSGRLGVCLSVGVSAQGFVRLHGGGVYPGGVSQHEMGRHPLGRPLSPGQTHNPLGRHPPGRHIACWDTPPLQWTERNDTRYIS